MFKPRHYILFTIVFLVQLLFYADIVKRIMSYVPGIVWGMFERDNTSNQEFTDVMKLLEAIKTNIGTGGTMEYDISEFLKINSPKTASPDLNYNGKAARILLQLNEEFNDNHTKGVINFGLREGTNGFVDIEFDIDLTGNYTYAESKLHTSFALTFQLKGTKETAFKLITYDYESCKELLAYLNISIDPMHEYFIKKYADAVVRAKANANALDKLFETIPDFVINSNEAAFKDDNLMNYLVAISTKTMVGSVGSDEDRAAINIMRGFKDYKKLYDFLYLNNATLLKLYHGIDGDECFEFVNILADLSERYNTVTPYKVGLSYNDYIPSASDNYMFMGNVDINNLPPKTTSHIDGPFTILTPTQLQGATVRYRLDFIGSPVINSFDNYLELSYGAFSNFPDDKRYLNRYRFNNLLDKITICNGNGANTEVLPVIYGYHLEHKQILTDRLEGLNAATTMMGLFGSVRTLFSAATLVAKVFAVGEIAKLAIDQFMRTPANRALVASWGSEGAWLAKEENWNMVSSATDFALLSGQFLSNFVRNGSRVASTLREQGKINEAVDLEKLIVSASKPLSLRNKIVFLKDKLGFKPKQSTNFNFTDFVAKEDGSFTDIIVHYSNGRYIIAKKSVSADIDLEKLAELIDQVPTNKKIRLLSCNSLEAARELSTITKRPFHASEGWVDLYEHGKVRSQQAFVEVENGVVKNENKLVHEAGEINGKQKIRLGEEVGQAGNWISKLDNLGLTALKTEINLLDDVAKAKFFDKFAGASDDALRAMNENTSLVSYWKINGDFIRNKTYPNVGHKAWDDTKNAIITKADPTETKILNAIENSPPPTNNQVAVAGAYSPELGGNVVIK
jgi:hypothetical protein